MRHSFFDLLPEEVLRTVLGYMDIPSLAAISASHKAHHRNVAYLASDDVIWYPLIQARFGIGCNHRRMNSLTTNRTNTQEGVVLVTRGGDSSSSSLLYAKKERRPTSYGGKDWKDVYQAFSCIMRIPETSITSASQRSGSGAVFASPCHRRARNFGVWCLVNHTENCRTKTIEGQRMGSVHHRQLRCNSRNSRSRGDSIITFPYRADRRYIELKLCMQNTRSGNSRMIVPNVSSILFASLEEEEYFSMYGWDQWDENYDSTFKLVKAGPWAPKIALRRGGLVHNSKSMLGDNIADWNATCCDLVFHPFDVIVLSVHISCPESQVYETDVLSSMSSIRVPVVMENSAGDDISKKDTSVAYFLTEDKLWDYYCQLPGGYLSLTDRSRLIPV